MRAVALVFWLLAVVGASAHQNSIAYLFLDQTNSRLNAHWEIPVHDLELSVGLDANKDGEVTWAEIREHTAIIRDYAMKRIVLRSESNSIPIAFTHLEMKIRPAGAMVVLFCQAQIPSRTPVTLEYNFGFDEDSGHQCILSFQDRTAVLTKDRRNFELVEAATEQSFTSFVRVGVFHIFEGIDHICFLLAFMLPAVWQRTERGWEAVGSLRAAFISITKIVTAFTVAHSITLAIAALRILVLPSAFVESAIAFSVVVAALNLASFALC